ncbi:hypothetical protein AB1N83_008927 [Pleurotus pulmonarius]
MAAHGWTNEAATHLYFPRGDVAYGAIPPTRTNATPLSLTTPTNTSIVQGDSSFAADVVDRSALGFESRHTSIYYGPHVAIDGGTGLWPGAGRYLAGPDFLNQSEALSDGAQLYADWPSLRDDVQEGVTLLSAYEPMCSFGQASGGVSAGGSILPVPRPVVASEQILYASESRRFRQAKYKCQHCPSKFTTKQNCNRHINAHWNFKPFICTQCGKRFTTKSDMTRHQRKTHQGSDGGHSMGLVRV